MRGGFRLLAGKSDIGTFAVLEASLLPGGPPRELDAAAFELLVRRCLAGSRRDAVMLWDHALAPGAKPIGPRRATLTFKRGVVNRASIPLLAGDPDRPIIVATVPNSASSYLLTSVQHQASGTPHTESITLSHEGFSRVK